MLRILLILVKLSGTLIPRLEARPEFNNLRMFAFLYSKASSSSGSLQCTAYNLPSSTKCIEHWRVKFAASQQTLGWVTAPLGQHRHNYTIIAQSSWPSWTEEQKNPLLITGHMLHCTAGHNLGRCSRQLHTTEGLSINALSITFSSWHS